MYPSLNAGIVLLVQSGGVMTKNSLIFAATLFASISIAGVAFAQNSAFEGAYVGGQVGYSSITDEVKVAGITVIDETADGFGGGGFVGFGGTNGSLYGAVQAEVGYDGAQWSISGSSGTTSATLDVDAEITYGVDFRIGGVIADKYLIYGRAGWVRTNFKVSGTVTTATATGSASTDLDLDGLRFGGGLEWMPADNIGVRGEYTYTIYSVDDFTVNGILVEEDTTQHLFRIGVAYYF